MLTGVIIAIAGSLIAAAAEGAVVERTDPPTASVQDQAGPRDGALQSLESEQATLFANVAPSVVLLMRDGASGSGFVVARDGLVLTNAHVVGEGDAVTVQLADGRAGTGRVIARATGALDLALVRIPFGDLPTLVAGDPSALRAGTFAATVGHGGGAAWTFSTGLVANPRPLGDGAPMVLAQMALRPGSSGGPLVDRLGRAVAVVTAGTRDASGVTFAIRIDAAVKAFPQLQEWALGSIGTASGAAPPRAPRQEPAAPAEVMRREPEPRTPEVAQLSGASGLQRAPAAVEMVTVWEAPRAARRAAPRALPRRPLEPSHAAPAALAPTPSPEPQPQPPSTTVVIGLLAAALAGGALAWRAAAHVRAAR